MHEISDEVDTDVFRRIRELRELIVDGAKRSDLSRQGTAPPTDPCCFQCIGERPRVLLRQSRHRYPTGGMAKLYAGPAETVFHFDRIQISQGYFCKPERKPQSHQVRIHCGRPGIAGMQNCEQEPRQPGPFRLQDVVR